MLKINYASTMVWCAAEPKHCVCQWLTVLWGYRHNECAVWHKVRVGHDGEEVGVSKKRLSLPGMQLGESERKEESAVAMDHARGKKRTRAAMESDQKGKTSFLREIK